MRLRVTSVCSLVLAVWGITCAKEAFAAAEVPSVKRALSFRPVQKQVEYAIPKPEEYGKCQVKVERQGKSSGWVVLGPNGEILRRYVDTNADNIVDQWKYYNHGLEVYRDVDSNFNNKVDQSRWLNTGGSRWGLDTNEDGRIDTWKILSPEEATLAAIAAMSSNDERALQLLLISQSDVRKLGIKPEIAKQLLSALASPGKKMQAALSGSKLINRQTRWMRFDGSTPSIIPADEGKANGDLNVYENVMAFVETNGKTGLVQIGELVRVGECWKLTQIPKPLEGNSVEVTMGGTLMQLASPGGAVIAANAGGTGSAESQKLLKELQQLDESSPTPAAGTAVLARYNSRRADLLGKLVKMSKTKDERTQWTRQMVDGIAAAVQTGVYPEGVGRLKSIERQVRQAEPKSETVPYITYRRMLAMYSVDLQKATNAQRQKVQDRWLKELEEFAKTYPKSEDAAEAILQLAISQEFVGKTKPAEGWYRKLTASHPASRAAVRAAGALRRLDLENKPFRFSGPALKGGTIDASNFRGRVLLVLFWSTWCKPCTEDLPQIRALYQKHHGKGFEILGINLDTTAQPVQGFLTEHKVSWPQIHQPGGLDSEPARTFGIISLPTMFLVDSSGKVVSHGLSVDDLKTRLPKLLKK